MRTPRRIDVLYDDRCALCCAVAARLKREQAIVPLRFLPITEAATVRAYPTLVDRVGQGKFAAVTDAGEVYLGPKGKLLVLYALRRYRSMSLRLASPALWPVASRFFWTLSARRHGISRLMELVGFGRERCAGTVCEMT